MFAFGDELWGLVSEFLQRKISGYSSSMTVASLDDGRLTRYRFVLYFIVSLSGFSEPSEPLESMGL